MRDTNLSGVIPPLSTPLTEKHEIDTESLVNLIEYQVANGVDALFVLGTTGESTFLTDSQRDTVVATAVGAVRSRVPVLSGVVDMSTARVKEHIKRAVDLNVDGIVATAPFYAATHPAEIEAHFAALKDAAPDTPIYAYDIPSRINGTKLPADSLVKLGQAKIIAGVKDSSGSDVSIRTLLRKVKESALENFSVLTGSELTVDSALAFGADGVVPGLGNVDPAGYVRLYRAARSGDWATARAEQDRLFSLFEIVRAGDPNRMGESSAAMGAFKTALNLLGVIKSPTAGLPSVPLNESEISTIKEALKTANLI